MASGPTEGPLFPGAPVLKASVLSPYAPCKLGRGLGSIGGEMATCSLNSWTRPHCMMRLFSVGQQTVWDGGPEGNARGEPLDSLALRGESGGRQVGGKDPRRKGAGRGGTLPTAGSGVEEDGKQEGFPRP